MNKREFTAAYAIAKDWDIDLTNEDLDAFSGYGLPDFKPIYVTVRQVARIIRWQCAFWDGTWNQEELNNIGYHGRKRFIIIG